MLPLVHAAAHSPRASWKWVGALLIVLAAGCSAVQHTGGFSTASLTLHGSYTDASGTPLTF
jgi:hypothetical protein